jgi:hypothetical protein
MIALTDIMSSLVVAVIPKRGHGMDDYRLDGGRTGDRDVGSLNPLSCVRCGWWWWWYLICWREDRWLGSLRGDAGDLSFFKVSL